MRDVTEEEVKEAYKIARKLAMDFMQNHYITHLTIDDYVQEGIMAWLQGRDIKNALVDTFRKAAPLEYRSYGKSREPVPLSVPFEDTISKNDDNLVERLDSTIDFRKIVMKLSKKQRAAFWLVFVKGYTFREVAKKLKITYQAVHYRYQDAIKFLRKEYQNA